MNHGGYLEGIREIAQTILSRSMSSGKKRLRLGVRFNPIRTRAIRRVRNASHTRARMIPAPTALPGLDVEQAVEDLRSDGLSLSIRLSQSIVAHVLSECRRLSFQIERDARRVIPGASVVDDPENGFDGQIAATMDPHRHIDVLEQLTRDERILAVVEAYLGVPPVFDSTQIWFTRPNPEVKASDAHLYGFHYDIADYRFVVITIYLNDVSESHGPHVFVKTSHADWSLAKKVKRRISDHEALRRYGQKNVSVITGAAGTGFFADNLAYHKGARPLKPRSVLQLIYTLRASATPDAAVMR